MITSSCCVLVLFVAEKSKRGLGTSLPRKSLGRLVPRKCLGDGLPLFDFSERGRTRD